MSWADDVQAFYSVNSPGVGFNLVHGRGYSEIIGDRYLEGSNNHDLIPY